MLASAIRVRHVRNCCTPEIDRLPHVVVDWVDWRTRRIPLKKGSIRGFHPGRLGEAAIPFESLGECEAISALLKYEDVSEIQSQPFTIHFRADNQRHRYTPDLLVQFRSVPNDLFEKGFERLTLVECKPPSKLPDYASSTVLNRAAIAEITSVPLVVVIDAALTTAFPEVRDEY